MKLEISNEIFIDEIKESDRSSYLKYLNDAEVTKYIDIIPYPYTDHDVNFWFNLLEIQLKNYGKNINFAIRKNGELIGGIGFSNYDLNSHKAEIGYWLALDYQKKGIMTVAVGKFTEYAMQEFNLIRLEGNVFDANLGSQKILLKNNFIPEGKLKKYYLKNGVYYDRFVFARILE